MKKYRSFTEARKFALKLGLKDGKDYKRYYESGKVPDDIPKCPWAVYSKEWEGMGDFLGTGFVAAKYRKFRSFEDARKFARSLKLKDQTEWHKYSKSDKKPEDIPANPRRHYQKEWVSMGDWLGTGYIANQNRKYISYNDAKKIVHKLKLKNKDEWVEYSKSGKKPDDIPANPPSPYKKEWKGWGDFLGTGTIATFNKVYLPPIEAKIEARKYQKKLGIKTQKDWEIAYKSGKIPSTLPASLWNTYGRQRRRRNEANHHFHYTYNCWLVCQKYKY